EEYREGRFRAAVRLTHAPAILDAGLPERDAVPVVLQLDDRRDEDEAVGRIRRLLDLDADPVATRAVLGGDPVLAPLVAAAPGQPSGPRAPPCPGWGPGPSTRSRCARSAIRTPSWPATSVWWRRRSGSACRSGGATSSSARPPGRRSGPPPCSTSGRRASTRS